MILLTLPPLIIPAAGGGVGGEGEGAECSEVGDECGAGESERGTGGDTAAVPAPQRGQRKGEYPLFSNSHLEHPLYAMHEGVLHAPY